MKRSLLSCCLLALALLTAHPAPAADMANTLVYAGENEDTRRWDALMVFTDLYTYFYGFNMSADYAGELDDLREDVFSQLELVFPEE